MKKRFQALAIALSTLPAVVLSASALSIHSLNVKEERASSISEGAKLAAFGIDQHIARLLEITNFCVSDPALTGQIHVEEFKSSCGRYAKMFGAWVVVITLGDVHKHIINTRPDVEEELPYYPRSEERPELIALEELSRSTGKAAISQVFRGRLYTGGIVSAGHWFRLNDGREAMIYVSFSAETISDLLAQFSADGKTIFALVDPSRRIVARSEGIEEYLFSEAPKWVWESLEQGLAGAQLDAPGPEKIGGVWDAGYYPLSSTENWMALAVKSVDKRLPIFRLFSPETSLVFLGIFLSAILFWFNDNRVRAAMLLKESTEKQRVAERSSQEKSRLLASFAHDVRSPLISMIGALTGIDKDELNSKADLSIARKSAENLLQLIDDIIELSFLGSGEFSLNPTPVDLRKLAQDVFVLVETFALRKGLVIDMVVSPDLPGVVEIDRLRLQQVLGNLLSNAVKYTENGKITLRIEVLSEGREGIELRFAVEDTGVGVPPEERERIFREFGRLERSIERREPGTGLGLAICKRILRAMGSELKITSNAGRGSIFWFTLKDVEARRSSLPLDSKPLSGFTILYGEDEPVIRKITSRQLEDAGATVVPVADGIEVLTKLKTLTPDLLLLDMQMPGLSGPETIRRVNAANPARRFPIYVLTSHISGSLVNEAKLEGAEEVFTKPVQILPIALSLLARLGKSNEALPKAEKKIFAADDDLISLENFLTIARSDLRGLIDRHLPEFEERMREDIAKLTSCADDGDLESVGRLSHRCLGVCQVLGASALARRLKAIELAVENKSQKEVSEILGDMKDILNETLNQMKAHLGRFNE